MKTQRELLRRSFGFDRRLRAEAVLTWANSVGQDLHPGFRRMLEADRKSNGGAPVTLPESVAVATNDEPKRMDPREKLSMAKLLVAIAIDTYGYVPDAKRSPIPKELESIAARLGLEITHDTIRSYLRLGADQLPKDWNPRE